MRARATMAPRIRKGSKVHIAVDTLGYLLALRVTPANEQERAQVGELTADVQAVTGNTVELAYVDQGYTGKTPAADAAAHGMQLEVIKLSEAKRGFVLLPRHWVVERSFAWTARFRRLARDYERLPQTLAGLHYIAFACLMLHRALVTFTSPYQALEAGGATPAAPAPRRARPLCCRSAAPALCIRCARCARPSH